MIFLIFAVCSAANISTSIDTSASSATSAKLKRKIVDPGHDTPNNQEQFRGTQSTPRISSPQDINSRPLAHYRNAKTSDTQRVPNHGSGSHAYGSVPKRPLSYTSSPIQQTESRQGSPLAPYFNILNNPSTYKATTSAEKPLDASKSIVSQSVQKLQEAYSPGYGAFHQDKSIELSDFSDFEFPTYSSISKILSQGIQNGASSPAQVQVPVYKSSYPLPKVTEHAHVYSPSLSTASNIAPLFRSSDKVKQISRESDEVTVDVNGKKISVPVIQLQSTPDLSGVFPVFESQPFLLSADYLTESDLGFNFGSGPKFNMALQSKNASPFSSPLSSFQGQVVPIQTASSTPQFPQYKGASIQVYPVVSNNVPKLQGSYESLYSQPQLHFGKEHGGQPANAQQNIGHPSISTEDILEDVEIVNKKNPEPHPSQTDDDDEEGESLYRFESYIAY